MVEKKQHPIYLDYNASALVPDFLRESLSQVIQGEGNPSSVHAFGRRSKKIIREARSALAQMLNVSDAEIVFTSGGSESNNHVLKSMVFKNLISKSKKNRLLVSAVEHASVMRTLEDLQAFGLKVDVIPVNKQGELDMKTFYSLLSDDVSLVSIMSSNNETGILFPIPKIAKAVHKVGALLHCDATQSLGKQLVDLKKWGVDYASFSAHKFYGFQGCGALYMRRGASLPSLISGGGQERGWRAGTENILGIHALGTMAMLSMQPIQAVAKQYNDFNNEYLNHASSLVQKDQGSEIDLSQLSVLSFFYLKTKFLRDWMEQRITETMSDIYIVGKESKRLPNTSNILFANIDAQSLIINLDLKGVAVSSGSACGSGRMETSSILKAMQFTEEEARGSLRVSLGWWTSLDEVKYFVTALSESVGHLQKLSSRTEALV